MSHSPSKLTLVDLFCGAGGLALGFASEGCHVLAAVDYDSVAGQTYAQNFAKLQGCSPPRVLSGSSGDLTKPEFDEIHDSTSIDLLVGGPPCQGFSLVGRGKLNRLQEKGVYEHGFENDPRNILYKSFLDALRYWRPRCVVAENVPGILNVRGMNYADVIAWDIWDCGYDVGYAVLNASWYGVPQFRERLIFVGFRRDLGVRPTMPRGLRATSEPRGYLFQHPIHEEHSLLFTERPVTFELPVKWEDRSQPPVSSAEALQDLPRLILDQDKGVPRGSSALELRRPYSRRVKKGTYAWLMRNWPGFPAAQDVGDNFCRANKRDYETFRKMKAGDRYPEAWGIARWGRLEETLDEFEKAEGWRPEEGSDEFKMLAKRIVPPYPLNIFPDKWRKLVRDQPSWTVTAHLSKDGYSHIHYDDEQARTITVREAARLQSFPDQFEFSGNLGDRFRQIGNAVPPLLAQHIAKAVISSMGAAQKGNQ